jgi:nucleotide-binding universal stress UspA family protein
MAVESTDRDPRRKPSEGGIEVTGAIICGVDGSESARGAARVARSLASELGVGVIFVRVLEQEALDATEVTTTAQRLEGLTAAVTDVDSGAAWHVEAGHPSDGLVAAAKKARAAMIVVGSTGPRSSLLGSVSADVSRRAPCPVVVVPPGADARVEGDGPDADVDGTEFAGGIARFGIGDGGTDFAGGIVRFGLGSAKQAG